MTTAQVRIDYAPTPRQTLFHLCSADECLYGGAAGGGKSRAVVMEALIRCLETPRVRAYLFRRTFRELEDTLIAEACAAIPAALGRYVAASHEFRFRNGSVMRFRHCQHDRDRFRYQGAEMDYLFIDELTHFTQTVYDYLKTRLRTRKTTGIRPVVRCTANPGGVGHGWVKAYFIDPNPGGGVYTRRVASQALGRYQERTVAFIPARATDNPHLSEDYIFELEQKPPALRKALLEGDWNAFEGQAFPEWTDDPAHYDDGLYTHVIAPFPIPAAWRRYRSFDFGYARPFSVGWWAADPDGRLYRYAEWYGAAREQGAGANAGLRLSPAEIARGIAEFESRNQPGIPVHGVADPSIFDGSRGESVARQMERFGVYFMPGNNARLAGKMQLHYRLRFDGDGRPGLYVFHTCRDAVRTLPALAYAARPGIAAEDVDTSGEDHIYDECRYLLMENPLPAEVRPHPVVRPYDPLSVPERRARKLP